MESIWITGGVGIGSLIFGALAMNTFRNFYDEKIRRNAHKEAERIVSRAEREASRVEKDAKKRASEVETKVKKSAEKDIEKTKQNLERTEKSFKNKQKQLEAEYRDKQEEIKNKKRHVESREEKIKIAEKKMQDFEAKSKQMLADLESKLEGVANYSAEQAKNELVEVVKTEAKAYASQLAARIEEEAREDAEARAKRIIGIAISRYSGEYVAERSASVVELPNEEIKGKIIGREGRNIRALETACGVDLIVDETPEAVVISGFDPVRRELARRTLTKLIEDGRIHPGKIEEVLDKEKKELFKSIQADGEKALYELGIHGVNPEITKLLGSLKYRTSYTQNNYTHSIECGFICGMMAAEMGANVQKARRAAVLHDVGKALDHSVAGSHAVIGADFVKKYGESEAIVHAIRAHHEDEKPNTLIAHLVQAADALSSARPGARKQMTETYVNRLEELESIANSFDGVIRSYALQAGREIRVLVEGSKISDGMAVGLSRDIARKIEQEMSYPGQIKVTVVREIRAVDHAR